MYIDKFATQLRADQISVEEVSEVPGLLWGTRRKTTTIKRPPRDDEAATRHFTFRAPLLRVMFSQGEYTLILDGASTDVYQPEEITFRIAPKELGAEQTPLAQISFSKTECDRRGTPQGKDSYYSKMRYNEAECIFASREQLDAYLAVGSRLPKGFRFGGTEYHKTSGGDYQSDDGSILPWLVVMYLLLPSNERAAFAGQNPELQQMLDEQASSTDNVTPAQPQGQDGIVITTGGGDDTNANDVISDPADSDGNSDSGDAGGGDGGGGDGGGGGGDGGGGGGGD